MSTMHHQIQKHTGWTVAAAAVAVGLLALLVISVLSAYVGDRSTDAPAQVHNAVKHVPPPFAHGCFAHRPGASAELNQPGCTVP